MTRDEVKAVALAAGLRPSDLNHFIFTKPVEIPWTRENVRQGVEQLLADPKYATYVAPFYERDVPIYGGEWEP